MKIPFYCPAGHVLVFNGQRIRFVEQIEELLVFRFVDGKEEIVRVPRPGEKTPGLPSITWALREFRAGNLRDLGAEPALTDGRANRYLYLDRAACKAVDPKSPWRFDWADAAIAAKITRTEDSARIWIASANVDGPNPQPRSLLRWMAKLDAAGGRIGALVNGAGRLKGQSQFSDVEDRLIHKWAIIFWRPPHLLGRLRYKEDAAAMVVREWDELKALGIQGLADEPPSAEAVRVRINSLECYSTHASRYGRPSADKKYSANGEPVPVERPFERIYMDGTEYEHSVFYSDDLKIPADKMKGVMAMDCFSEYVFRFPVFAGEYRPEMGLAALRNVMVPPDQTEEELEQDPEGGQIYGRPSDVMIDRDRTLIPPRAVPNTLNVVETVELAEAYHSDAKGKLEHFHKFVKERLALIPGRILGPRVKHDIGYDPIAATCLTRAQYVDAVEQCRIDWNTLAKDNLGKRSPEDIMRAYIQVSGPRLTDPGEVRRALSSTPSKPCVLTTDGLTYDNVHYRFNRDGITETLSSNQHNTPFAKRLNGTAKVEVTIRTWDDDIDMIEVYDEQNGKYHKMWSTDGGYTGGLSRWEHHIYQAWLRKGGGGATTKRDRLRMKGKRLEDMQKTLTGMAFRERGQPAALLEAEEKRLSGKRAANPNCATVPELGVPTAIGGVGRVDRPTPPPQKKGPVEPEDGQEEPDQRSDPSERIAEEIGEADPGPPARGASIWDDDEDEEQ